MTVTRTRITRLLAAVVFVVPVIVGSVGNSYAAPSEQDVENAKAEVDRLNQQLEVAAEAYNSARVRLDQAETRLAEAKQMMDLADAEAAKWRGRLSKRAVQAYTGMGSQLDVLLERQDLSEFSDRLQYMGAIAQSDTDLAAQAEAAGERARMAADEYAAAVTQRQAELDDMAAQRDQIQSTLDEQEALYQDLNQQYQEYQDALEAQRRQAALLAQQEAQQAREEATTPDPPPDPGGDAGGGGPFVPDPNASQAQTAIDAAKSMIGTGYVFGAADPSVGFDCSGLTMWAYAQAGVSLPHSSESQYAVLPHVVSGPAPAG